MPIIEYPNCTVCCPGQPCTCSPCTFCDNNFFTYPCVWNYSAPEFAAQGNDCNFLAGPLGLQMVGNCRWAYSAGNTLIVLERVGTVWRLTVGNPTPVAIYELADGFWACCAQNDLQLTQDLGRCGIGSPTEIPLPRLIRLTPIACNCGGPPPPCQCQPCGRCGTEPFPCTQVFNGTGFVGAVCTRLNRNINMRMAPPGECHYIFDAPGDVKLELSWDTANFTLEVWVYNPGLVHVATYRKGSLLWNCCAANVMNLVVNDGVCSTVPSTVTVSPGDACICGGQPCCNTPRTPPNCNIPCSLPNTLHGTVRNSQCPLIPNGTMVTMTFTGLQCRWAGEYSAGGFRYTFELRCCCFTPISCPNTTNDCGFPPEENNSWALSWTCEGVPPICQGFNHLPCIRNGFICGSAPLLTFRVLIDQEMGTYCQCCGVDGLRQFFLDITN